MDPEITYRTAVRGLVARFRWGLLTESAWIAAARQINPEPEDDKAARRVCLTVYSRNLHEACQDRRRQDQAYRELFDYLYPQAYARDAGLAFEAAQEAIVLVYRSFTEPKLAKCQQPETFLCFAQGKLRDAFKRLYSARKREKQNASIDWTLEENVKAKLKVIVKRTLRQFGYHPDMQKLATETVLKQVEMIADELTKE